MPIAGWIRYWRSGMTDRKSTRLNSSHITISYAVFCLKKKKKQNNVTDSIIPTSLIIHPSILLLFKHPATTEIYTLSLHDALPISADRRSPGIPEFPDR